MAGARPFADGTTVPPEKSRAELETVLKRYGAEAFAFAVDSEQGEAVVMFRAHARYVRFRLPLPTDLSVFGRDGAGRVRTPDARRRAAEAEERRRWRALVLAVKAKLEVVESGIATFEEEFLAHVVLPEGDTVGDWLAPQVEEAYRVGRMPGLLALGPGRGA